MLFEKLTVSQLGIFENLDLSFSKTKINLIQGNNGCGKTTVLAILYSMLQDKEALNYTCEDNKAVIKLQLSEGDREIRLEKSYEDNRPTLRVQSFEEMKRLLSVNRDKVYLISGSPIGRRKIDSKIIQRVNDFLEQNRIENRYKSNILQTDDKIYNLISGGEQAYYWLLNILSSVPQDSVLMMDAPFEKLEYDVIDQLLGIMRKMKHIQFILTSSLRLAVEEDCQRMILDTRSAGIDRYARVDFDYFRMFKDNLDFLSNASENQTEDADEKVIIKYELNKEVDEVEKREVEFKEVKGNNPCNSIVDTGEIYINAFLNSQVMSVGVIKWGISDDGVVKGVTLSKEDRDTIDRKLCERIGQMKPYVSTESVRILFEEIVHDGEIARDLFVVEVLVEPVASRMLFTTSKKEVYIKTDGGKRKLDPLDIQEELKRRLK